MRMHSGGKTIGLPALNISSPRQRLHRPPKNPFFVTVKSCSTIVVVNFVASSVPLGVWGSVSHAPTLSVVCRGSGIWPVVGVASVMFITLR